MLGSVHKSEPRQAVIKFYFDLLVFPKFLDQAVVSDRLDLCGVSFEGIPELKQQERILEWIDDFESDGKPLPFAIEYIPFMLSQAQRSGESRDIDCRFQILLPLHRIHLIEIRGPVVPVNRDDEREADGGFGGGDGDG